MAQENSDINGRDTTSEVRKILNGDSNHYDVSQGLRKDNTRYFNIRGNSEMKKTLRSLVENATDYTVVNSKDWGDRFKVEIERE